MTGPEHYQEAEELILAVSGRDLPFEQVLGQAAVAQVHATLALAAATALGRVGEGLTMAKADVGPWMDAASTASKPLRGGQ